jgi:D-sedoheptulose 7-phosphate isomerase
MNEISEIQNAFEEMQTVLSAFATVENFGRIDAASAMMAAAVQQGGKIIACGNGGSMSDAMHFAEELSGRFRDDRPSIPALSISDPSHISCVANDYGYDQVFSRYIQGLGKAGDVLLAISTSGNSANVIKAAEVSRALGIKVVSLTGKTGGALAAASDIEIRVPHNGYADRIQEIHIKVIHLMIQGIEQRLKA